MKVSIRNRFDATVQSTSAGPAMTTVRARLAGGTEITAAITSDSATELELQDGTPVQILIKSTEVSVAVDPPGRMSIRNRLPGTLTAVEHGTAMTVVKLELDGGGTLTAAITHDSAEDLGLAEGMRVTGLVKSTDVAIAVA